MSLHLRACLLNVKDTNDVIAQKTWFISPFPVKFDLKRLLLKLTLRLGLETGACFLKIVKIAPGHDCVAIFHTFLFS